MQVNRVPATGLLAVDFFTNKAAQGNGVTALEGMMETLPSRGLWIALFTVSCPSPAALPLENANLPKLSRCWTRDDQLRNGRSGNARSPDSERSPVSRQTGPSGGLAARKDEGLRADHIQGNPRAHHSPAHGAGVPPVRKKLDVSKAPGGFWRIAAALPQLWLHRPDCWPYRKKRFNIFW